MAIGGFSLGFSNGFTLYLDILTTSLPNIIYNVPYSNQLFASTANVEWSVVSGALPSGINLSGSGLVNGSSTALGSYPVIVRALHSETSTFDDQIYALRVGYSGVFGGWPRFASLQTFRPIFRRI